MLYELNCSACNGFQIPFDETKRDENLKEKLNERTNEKYKKKHLDANGIIMMRKYLCRTRNCGVLQKIACVFSCVCMCVVFGARECVREAGNVAVFRVYKYGDQ